MDANAPRPRSRGQGLRSAQEQGNVVRKVFNCIVDDSALVQGAKKSTRDGIPKWVAAGAIRLFVPLFGSSYPPLLSRAVHPAACADNHTSTGSDLAREGRKG